ncbi:hypothetical protein NPN27_08130 [Stutzerimonas stutzeri]|uniref:hypothetical protein n=1 Tax=Stutzerimonas stutzeri TaxID=316 RepID=UPI0021110942|nr:hypothetical protein [Stutzerimonas stutzeri]UUC85094.1 hypothetical protein NPN27_08130 [Stutzerimonas stutzeri]
MVAIVRVPVADFSSERLDTGFYSKEFYAARAQIERSSLSLEPIGAVCEPWQFGAYALCNDIVWSNEKDGVPFLKAEAIESPLVNDSALSYVTKATHSLLSKSALKAGDIIMSTSGTVGRLAVLPDSIPFANSNQDTIKFSLSGTSYDSHFVAAWLTSKYAQAFMNREAGGAVQQHIYLYNFKRLPLLKISPTAQQYIGEKVRQAERLRAWTRLTETQINQYHQRLVPQQTGLDFAKRVRVVTPARMSERLDAHFYPGVVDEYLRLHQGEFKPLGKLCATIYNGQTQPETGSSHSCQQITVTNLSSSFLGGVPRDVEAPRKNEKFLKAYDVLMCNAAHNKSYIGKDLTFVHSEAAILPSTEVMTIRVDRNQVPASYVRAYLLTKLGYVQIQSTIRGITAHSYPDDMALLDIYVPDVADKDKEEWFACDEKLALAGKACEVATKLTNAAKLLVEALIEGQLTEAELLTAEKALQAGNDRLDRFILSRLNTGGIDGQGPALFGDLDELYHLLTQAEGD